MLFPCLFGAKLSWLYMYDNYIYVVQQKNSHQYLSIIAEMKSCLNFSIARRHMVSVNGKVSKTFCCKARKNWLQFPEMLATWDFAKAALSSRVPFILTF